MGFYYGNLHSHTLYSDGLASPSQAYAWARDVARFDFYAITDHAEELAQIEWEDTGDKADMYNAEGSFLALRGFEWSSPSLGHVNVFGSDDYTGSDVTSTLESLYQWIGARDAPAQFNHPARDTGYFEGFRYYPEVSYDLCLCETGNRDTGNNDLSHYLRYQAALDKGWRLAPTNNQDNHGLASFSNRTVIISPELTQDGLFEALRERRVYSSDDPDIRIAFKLGERWMGSVVENRGETAQFDVAVEDDEDIVSLQLITAGGRVAARRDFDPGEDSRSVTWSPTVEVGIRDYFFLRVIERDENGDDGAGWGEQVAVTSPIWLEREGTNWYLAEGCTAGGFETWILVQNPGSAPADVELTFMTEEGPVSGPSATIPPESRLTWNAGTYVTSFHVSTRVASDQAVVAERAVYWGDRGGGHDSIGATAPAPLWYLAEGCTAGGFETWILVQNPGSAPADVELTFMTEEGPVSGPSATIPPESRLTWNAGTYVTSFHVSTRVASDQAVVAERAVYWNSGEVGHCSLGFSREESAP
ncbi:MAG: DUF5719 family protein [Actinomycetota bacterium]